MDIQAIFLIQFLMSLLVWGLLAYWLLVPWLKKKSVKEALFYLVIPHAFRHVGMMFLIPGIGSRPLPESFAGPAGYGDLLAAILAILSLIAIRCNWSFAKAFVWIFSIAGSIDLVNALRQIDTIPGFGVAWYIPTFLVPLLIVTHILIFIQLIKKEDG